MSRFDSTGTLCPYLFVPFSPHFVRGGPSAHRLVRQKRLLFLWVVFRDGPAVGFDDHTVFWNHRSIVALVTILIDTMKFTTSVVAVALAAAAPSVSGTSAGISLRIYNRFANICVRSAILEFVTNKSSKHGTAVVIVGWFNRLRCRHVERDILLNERIICKEIDGAAFWILEILRTKALLCFMHASSVTNSIPLLKICSYYSIQLSLPLVSAVVLPQLLPQAVMLLWAR